MLTLHEKLDLEKKVRQHAADGNEDELWICLAKLDEAGETLASALQSKSTNGNTALDWVITKSLTPNNNKNYLRIAMILILAGNKVGLKLAEFSKPTTSVTAPALSRLLNDFANGIPDYCQELLFDNVGYLSKNKSSLNKELEHKSILFLEIWHLKNIIESVVLNFFRKKPRGIFNILILGCGVPAELSLLCTLAKKCDANVKITAIDKNLNFKDINAELFKNHIQNGQVSFVYQNVMEMLFIKESYDIIMLRHPELLGQRVQGIDSLGIILDLIPDVLQRDGLAYLSTFLSKEFMFATDLMQAGIQRKQLEGLQLYTAHEQNFPKISPLLMESGLEQEPDNYAILLVNNKYVPTPTNSATPCTWTTIPHSDSAGILGQMKNLMLAMPASSSRSQRPS